jgi:Tfp pilus assembly protein PilE
MNFTSANSVRGFALAQHLVVSVIFVILVTIAAPSCTRHFQKGRLTEGVQSLGKYELAMESYYLAHGAYGKDDACGVSPPAGNELFAWSCEADGEAFTATLVGKGALEGYKYVLDTSAKPHKTVIFEGNRVANNSCWMTREAHC